VNTATSLRLVDTSTIRAKSVPFEMETVDCPLCWGGKHDTVLFAKDDVTHFGGSFRIVRCQNCELTFTNPRPTARSLGLFYPEDYKPHLDKGEAAHPRGEFRGRLERALLRQEYGFPPQPTDLRNALRATLARVVIRRTRARERWIPFRAPGRLLDFGCGAGDFLRHMRGYGWTVEGLDLSPRMVETLRQKGEFPAHLGSLPHPQIPAGSFDAITMWHSLEHVPAPRDVLRAAAHALRPRGVLGITVPNLASWSFQQFGPHWLGLAVPRHLTHFTPATLCRMVEASGFRILRVGQVGRDGWIRKSARQAANDPSAPRWLSLLRSKGPAALVARWTELAGQADSVRLIAEKS
jgi:2-polyprenyl-3-methyl-5-hydroxy-6-metoxy-1,4-benzoquinol methylase